MYNKYGLEISNLLEAYSIEVINRAAENARELKQENILTQNLLIGVVQSGGIGGEILREFGMNYFSIKSRFPLYFGDGFYQGEMGDPEFAYSSRKCLERAESLSSKRDGVLRTEDIVRAMFDPRCGALASNIISGYSIDGKALDEKIFLKALRERTNLPR